MIVYLVDGVEVDAATYSREFIKRGGVQRVEAVFAAIALARDRAQHAAKNTGTNSRGVPS